MRKRATGVVIYNNKVLLVRGPHERQFSLPGGKIEPWESGQEALRRELEEELGITPDQITSMKSYYSGKQMHYPFTVYISSPPVFHPNWEIKDLYWWDLNKVPTVSVRLSAQNIVHMVLGGLRHG